MAQCSWLSWESYQAKVSAEEEICSDIGDMVLDSVDCKPETLCDDVVSSKLTKKY